MAPTVALAAAPTLRRLYHSPQTPGYSPFVGAALGESGIEIAFTLVTGDPAVNPHVGDMRWDGVTKEFVRLQLGLAPGAAPTMFDRERFTGPPHAYSGQPYFIDLATKRRWRRVNNEDRQVVDNSLPASAYLQYRDPGMMSWSAPVWPVDPRQRTVQYQRVRKLRDGRLIASGNVWAVPSGTRTRTTPNDYLVMASKDNGATWQDVLTNDRQPFVANEWSWAELPSGDLLAVCRTKDPDDGTPTRRTAILKRNADGTFTMGNWRTPPFPHSGFPEVIGLFGGQVVLHLATTGIHYTVDGGATWKVLGTARTNYYPVAVKVAENTAGDGTGTVELRVYSHVGADDDYRERDQQINELRLPLKAAGLQSALTPPPPTEPTTVPPVPHGTTRPPTPTVSPANTPYPNFLTAGTKMSCATGATLANIHYEIAPRGTVVTPTEKSPFYREPVELPVGNWTVIVRAQNTAGWSSGARRDWTVK